MKDEFFSSLHFLLILRRRLTKKVSIYIYKIYLNSFAQILNNSFNFKKKCFPLFLNYDLNYKIADEISY